LRLPAQIAPLIAYALFCLHLRLPAQIAPTACPLQAFILHSIMPDAQVPKSLQAYTLMLSSPGAAVGKVVFTADDAVSMHKQVGWTTGRKFALF
jgi:hypothetical protein